MKQKSISQEEIPEPDSATTAKLTRLLGYGQALFYLVTGVMPFISIKAFMAITGPKVDQWLVKTVGALVTVVGIVIGTAVKNGRVGPEIKTLAVGSAASLAGIDLYYVARRRISPVYLLDALAEFLLVAGWALAGKKPAAAGRLIKP